MADKIYFAAGGLDCVVATSAVIESTSYIISGFSFVTIQTPSTVTEGFTCSFTDQDTGEETTATDFWTHANVRVTDYATGPMFQWCDAAGDPKVRVQQHSTFVYYLEQNIGGTWTTIGDPVTATNNHDWDIHIKIATAGQIQLFVDSVLISAFAGDTSALGAIGSLLGGFSSGTRQYYQQIIVADFNTIGHTVRARKVTAAGASQTWNGPYGNVSTYPMDSGQFITSQTADELNTHVGTTLSATPAGQKIRGVVLGLYIRRDSSGPQNAKGVLDIGGTEYDAAYNMRDVDLGFNGNIAIWTDNPATSAPWANITEANCDFGVKSVA